MNTTFFNTREHEGRYKWLSLNMRDILDGKKTIHYTSGDYDPYDFEMTATTVLSYGEIKTIHRNYEDYENFQIDYAKLKTLQDAAKKDSRIPYLVVFFNDWNIVWNIEDIDLEERKYTRNCTATTANYEKGKKEKEQVYVTITEAIWKKKNKEIMIMT